MECAMKLAFFTTRQDFVRHLVNEPWRKMAAMLLPSHQDIMAVNSKVTKMLLAATTYDPPQTAATIRSGTICKAASTLYVTYV